MPEGDSVFQLSRRLQFMTGRRVLGCSLRVPRWATTDVSGSTVAGVWPYGKYLFMDFGEQILQTHLKMEGTWRVGLKGDRWSTPGWKARVVLELEGAPEYPRPIEVVGFELGMVKVLPSADYAAAIAHLGPDVLGENWDEQEACERIARRPERAIGAALLDQRNLAGVGNEYRAEICFLAGLHPATPVSEVDVAKVVRITRRLMWANRLATKRVSTGINRIGETAYVFGRYARPCRRCGSRIEKDFLGGVDRGGDEGELERVIWFCPTCQPISHAG
ncbi:Formamidopyrimidine-DNA glycosylase [Corynebacterium ciconiae DSM 44920]|uniref:DNA-formamidopyrimidine glycosylase family protein n=1 Tax=Corynebacterium ciconiae TaxID=227319 RepID=UPI000381CA3F|nr:DNA-formamidopyrimidine glycosylase family protein [Corynebacterium ciconiae]WKD61679.1 Formamidopyrimidine-DNA glycosylase [Corynebacterium ciconiae DSM 44920]